MYPGSNEHAAVLRAISDGIEEGKIILNPTIWPTFTSVMTPRSTWRNSYSPDSQH